LIEVWWAWKSFKTFKFPPGQAHDEEKKLEDKCGVWIDRVYHLYAIVRRGNEEVPNRLFQLL